MIDPGEDQVSAYLVHWGDGFSNEYATAGNVTHTYCVATLTDDDGNDRLIGGEGMDRLYAAGVIMF